MTGQDWGLSTCPEYVQNNRSDANVKHLCIIPLKVVFHALSLCPSPGPRLQGTLPLFPAFPTCPIVTVRRELPSVPHLLGSLYKRHISFASGACSYPLAISTFCFSKLFSVVDGVCADGKGRAWPEQMVFRSKQDCIYCWFLPGGWAEDCHTMNKWGLPYMEACGFMNMLQ